MEIAKDLAFIKPDGPPMEWEMVYLLLNHRHSQAPVQLADKYGREVTIHNPFDMANLGDYMAGNGADIMDYAEAHMHAQNQVNTARFFMRSVAWLQSCRGLAQPVVVKEIPLTSILITRGHPSVRALLPKTGTKLHSGP